MKINQFFILGLIVVSCLFDVGCGNAKHTQSKKGNTTQGTAKRQPISQVTMATFDSKVLKNDKLIIVDFWTDWCGPCKSLAPVMEELAYEYRDKVVFYRINAEKDNNVYLTIDYEVRGYPTILYFKGGKNIDRQTGSILKEMISQRIDSNLSNKGVPVEQKREGDKEE
jgi:thioredoxin 1